jgi:hypothetical protein
VRWILAVIVALAPACSLVASLDDHNTTGGDAAPDVSSSDVQAPLDAAPDTATDGAVIDVAPRVVVPPNGDFEDTTGSGCRSWHLVGSGTLVRSTTAHTGSQACLVCPVGKALLAPISPIKVRSDAGTLVTLAAFWRQPPDAGVPDSSATVQFEMDSYFADGGYGPRITTAPLPVPASPVWARADVTLAIDSQTDSVDTFLAVTPSLPDECVLVDDVSLEQN